jgi:dipeptidyl-peptidase-3
MKRSYIFLVLLITGLLFSCSSQNEEIKENESYSEFEYFVEQFADVKILRYQVPGFDQLSLKQKQLVYYLSEAGMSGRDIMYDQNYRHNLTIRRALENVYQNYAGDKTSEDWKNFETYLKRIWFASGIHHDYANDKFEPGFSKAYLDVLLETTNTELKGEAYEVIFNDADSKKVNLDINKGLLKGSAVNFYAPDVTAEEAENYYEAKADKTDATPIEMGLNSKLVKNKNGQLEEKVWKIDGMYGAAIEKIVFWLEKAVMVAENEKQAKAIKLLVDYYKTGDLKIWDDYNIAWVESTEGDIDYINGFVEVYNDPKAYRGSYESVVQIKDFDMSAKMAILSKNAQWFEDNSPLFPEHKKKDVVGVSYKTVNVVSESGDASPSTPIGINLPNNNWIRQRHGSKSVSLGNIIQAYNGVGGTGRLKEFAFDEAEIDAEIQYGQLADKLHTSLHEVVGHASGQINPGIGQPKETLKNYYSTLEEGRADLIALYYLPSEKLVEMNLSPNAAGIGKAAFDGYIRNGLMGQLIRLKLGDDVEESHMRNRQLISAWAYEKGKADNVIEKVVKEGKTYFVIRDYEKLRILFGELLREIQRIKSEGDFEAGKFLVETYGVKVDPELHKEVLERNAQFKSAPYSGFVNPILVPVTDDSGEITDVQMLQSRNFAEQMLYYSERYSTLPAVN